MTGSMVGAVCKGSVALGSGCGVCERCASEVASGLQPTHRCKVCGALWRFWRKEETGFGHDSWNLQSPKCGPCCDNVPMGDQIEPLKPPKPAPKPPGVMDHRDVVDAARAHVADGGHVKFSLPVGAFLGGLYHLGGGVFVAKLPSPSTLAHHKGRFALPPESFGLHGPQSLLEAQPRFVALELCDNPLPSSLAAGEYRRVVPTHLTVKMVDAATGDQVWRSVESGKVIKRRGPKR